MFEMDLQILKDQASELQISPLRDQQPLSPLFLPSHDKQTAVIPLAITPDRS